MEWIGDGDGSIVVYLHGGGYCIGSLTSHRAMLTHLAAATEGRVLAVDYRLAPEAPLPGCVDDAIAAYRFVAAGHDPSSIVLAGDSAGRWAHRCDADGPRDAGDRLPAGGICLSPWTDLSQSGATTTPRNDRSDGARRCPRPLGRKRTPAPPIHADLS